MQMGRLEDVSFGASVRIMNEVEGDRARYEAISDMRMTLADRLVKAKMETIPGQFYTEYRMQVYIFTPEELMKVVHEKAEEVVRMREYYNKK